MKNIKFSDFFKNVDGEIVSHFGNGISTQELVDNVLSPLLEMEISEEKSDEIGEILAEYGDEFIDFPCGGDGLSSSQEKELNKIIKKCAKRIYDIVN